MNVQDLVNKKILNDNLWSSLFGDDTNIFKNSFMNNKGTYKRGGILIKKKNDKYVLNFMMLYITDSHINKDDTIETVLSPDSKYKILTCEITANDFDVITNNETYNGTTKDEYFSTPNNTCNIYIESGVHSPNISILDVNPQINIKPLLTFDELHF